MLSSVSWALWGLVWACLVAPSVVWGHDDHDDFRCGTVDPPKVVQELMEQQIGALSRRRSSVSCRQCIKVDTYMTIFQPFLKGDENLTSPNIFNGTVIAQQMKVLNDAFASTPFYFHLVRGSLEFHDRYYDDFLSESEKSYYDFYNGTRFILPLDLATQYRKGSYDTLNLYFGGNTAPRFGFATFPTDGGVTGNPADGAYCRLGTLPGGSLQDFNLGKTAVHEVGHWLGLYHTNQNRLGDACDPKDVNDMVEDTPQQYGKPRRGCPPNTTDSCPDLPGFDPIHNYMSPSNDVCYTEFTLGQIHRMYYVWSLYRRSGEPCSPKSGLFELELVMDQFPEEITWELVSTDGEFGWDYSKGQVTSGVGYSYLADQMTVQDICVDASKDYVFTIYDSRGDGIRDGGYYTIRYRGEVIQTGSQFGDIETTYFSGSSQPFLPATAAPVTFPPVTSVPTTSVPISSAPLTSIPVSIMGPVAGDRAPVASPFEGNSAGAASRTETSGSATQGGEVSRWFGCLVTSLTVYFVR